MILENTGYKKIDEVLQMHANNKPFSIYETHKGTHVLYHDIVGNLGVRGVTRTLYYPKKDRLPWKVTEGKKIARCTCVFNSTIDDIKDLDTSKWNNKNQIMSYEQFHLNF